VKIHRLHSDSIDDDILSGGVLIREEGRVCLGIIARARQNSWTLADWKGIGPSARKVWLAGVLEKCCAIIPSTPAIITEMLRIS
jgi:hypothetical protein